MERIFKNNVFLLVSMLLIFSACEKPGIDSGNGNCCLPPVYFEGEIGDTIIINPQTYTQELLHDTDQIYAGREMIFMPSAFTPDSNGLNDLIQVSLQNLIIWTSDTTTYTYTLEVHLTIYLGATKFFETYSNAPWNGQGPDGVIKEGIYRAEIEVLRDGIPYGNFNHYFRLILPDASGKLDKNFACLIFADQYESRLGLLFKTTEEFH